MSELKDLSDAELLEYYKLFKESSNRAEDVKVNKFDCKYSYHIIRLLSEAEQILATGDLDLQEKGRVEHMKAIRRGDVPEADIIKWASEKESDLEKLYAESSLPWGPDEKAIKKLLLECLEEHYGSIDNCIGQPDWAIQGLRDIDELVQKFRGKLY